MPDITQRLILFLAAAMLFPAVPGEASSKKASRLYSQGDYKASVEEYQAALVKDEESDIINFNAGTALYKNENYPEAIKHLQKALLTDEPGLKQRAHYNLGNSLYKFGKTQEEQDLEVAVESFVKSLDQYSQAMKLDAKDQDAKFNYDFVQKELERLNQKQEQQQGQQQNQDQQNHQDQKGQGEQSQDQKQQAQKSEDSKKDSQENQQNQDSKDGEKEDPGKDGKSGESQEQDQENQEDQKSGSGQEQQEDGKKQAQQQNSGSEAEDQQGGTPRTAVSSVGNIDPQELTEQEAQMLLEGYEQSVEPDGLMNFQIQKGRSQPVSKDW